ncbi:MAG: metalloregulator ArsR/SmtB family transcription factor [Myxococcales bacterium]|nr:metalloregulator ArsR/SmtB family transcription factor [Polyangiaceae bacterium]MDW8252101.1 metalloregulator ArsR/SmtB family transcription factor [Myxococcales bacterium]
MERWLERFKALADETRLELLAALQGDELSVGELVEVVGGVQSSVSRHLQALGKAGLVVARRQGTATFYRLAAEEPLLTGPFGEELRRLAQRKRMVQRVERVVARRRARNESFFDGAEHWDALRSELFTDAAGYSSLLPLVRPGLVVADVGTGTGGMLPYLAQVASHVVAIDLSANMLQRARAKAAALGLREVSFVQGDLGALPLERGAVDAAFAALVLHHAPRPLAALKEMARIVKPGGVVVVLDLMSHGLDWLREEQADVWLGFGRDEALELASRAGLQELRHRVVSHVNVRDRTGSGSKPLALFVLSGRVGAAIVKE